MSPAEEQREKELRRLRNEIKHNMTMLAIKSGQLSEEQVSEYLLSEDPDFFPKGMNFY